MTTIKYFLTRIGLQDHLASRNTIVFVALTILFLTISVTRMSAQTSTFVNPAPISVADNSSVSTINVSAVSGRVTKVVVTLNAFTHALPDDVGVLLVGPGGQKVRLITDVGGSTAIGSPINIPIDDRGAAYFPDNAALTTSITKPTFGASASAGDGNPHPANFPAPAPAGPYSVLLSDFIGTGANGTWTLYTNDDTPGNVGSIALGWTINITTGGVFTNAAAIAIPNTGIGTPYPSTIAVSGFTGGITKVSVRLNRLSHTYMDDAGFLLVGPTGVKTRLSTDNGGSNAVTNIDVLLDDTSTNFLPDSTVILSTSYRPNQGVVFSAGAHPANFPAPAPASPYSNLLSAFNGSNPNGTWSLYVDDDSAGDLGSIALGWTLAIESGAPTAAGVSISGRVTNSEGRGIAKVWVTLAGGSLAEPIYAISNRNGYYIFADIPSGQTYVVSVVSSRYHFSDPVRVINLGDSLAELDFAANP